MRGNWDLSVFSAKFSSPRLDVRSQREEFYVRFVSACLRPVFECHRNVLVFKKEIALSIRYPWQYCSSTSLRFMYHSFRAPRSDWNARERFTVKQEPGLIAAMILLSCINSLIVVTKSICYDTWGVIKLFNVYYKNNVCSRLFSHFSVLVSCSSSLRDLHDRVESQRPTQRSVHSKSSRFVNREAAILRRLYVARNAGINLWISHRAHDRSEVINNI